MTAMKTRRPTGADQRDLNFDSITQAANLCLQLAIGSIGRTSWPTGLCTTVIVGPRGSTSPLHSHIWFDFQTFIPAQEDLQVFPRDPLWQRVTFLQKLS